MSVVTIRSGPPPASGVSLATATWPARLDRKQEMIDTCAGWLGERGWVGAEDADWLVMCLDEAFVNAIIHGDEGDPRLTVHAELRRDDATWVLLITDEGEGFAADQLPDPEDPGSLLLEHGRGVLMLLSWLDKLRYYRGGATAWLQRRIAAAPAAGEG